MNTIVEKLNNEGVKLFIDGKINKAKRKYEEALKINPKYTSTLNNIGMLLLQSKDYSSATNYFIKANKEKESATYRLNLGHAYANQSLLVKAEENYLKSIQLNPNYLMAWNSLAILYQVQKKYLESINIWKYISQNYDNDVYYKIQIIKNLIELKEFQQALVILSKTTQDEKHQEISWYYTALIHFNFKNFGLAKEAIHRSVCLNPDNESFRILMASIYLSYSQLDKAILQWNYVLKINPSNNNARLDKAIALLAFNFKEEALQEFNIVLLNDKQNIKAHFYKALTYVEMNKNINEAKKILNEIKINKSDFTERINKLLKKIQ